MTDEPISVLIARAKGCSPELVFAWGCSHDPNLLHVPAGTCSLISAPEVTFPSYTKPAYEAWLTPAASFALLAEMVEGNRVSLRQMEETGRFEVHDYSNGAGNFLKYADTLAEAIARAWLAWKAQP